MKTGAPCDQAPCPFGDATELPGPARGGDRPLRSGLDPRSRCEANWMTGKAGRGSSCISGTLDEEKQVLEVCFYHVPHGPRPATGWQGKLAGRGMPTPRHFAGGVRQILARLSPALAITRASAWHAMQSTSCTQGLSTAHSTVPQSAWAEDDCWLAKGVTGRIGQVSTTHRGPANCSATHTIRHQPGFLHCSPQIARPLVLPGATAIRRSARKLFLARDSVTGAQRNNWGDEPTAEAAPRPAQ